jgi:hypothetical protein
VIAPKDVTITSLGNILRARAETEDLEIIIFVRGRKRRAKSHPEVTILPNPYSQEINDAVREATIAYLERPFA